METVKLSQKYQIVVPKTIRQKIKLSPGSRLSFYPLDEKRVIVFKQPQNYVQAMRGLGKEVWQKLGGADAYIKRERKSWDKK